LRDRLERVAQRVGFRCTDILVWDTGRLLVNAGVTGSLPWFRYVFLSDSLIEDLDVHEVAAVFGHEIGHIAHRHLVYFGFFILGSLSVIALAGGAINEALGAVPMPAMLAAGTPGALVVEGVMTLVIVGGYFFLAFGFLSRRFEGQADVFGCRVVSCGRPECPPHADLDARHAGMAVLARAPVARLCPVGVRIFVSALENVAIRNGMRPTAWSWRHGSILRRIAFLESLVEQPEAERRFQTRVRRIRWLMGAALAATAGLAVALAGG
jgi:STE24 endopeptidase